MMKLFHSLTSPFVRKVMVLLLETGQEKDVTLIAAGGSPIDPGTMPVAHNPLGKIPALLPEDGPALFDSRVICRFLDDRCGGQLYPKAPRLWECLTLEAMADGMLDAAVLMTYEQRIRTETQRSEAWAEGQWAKIARALDSLEASWLPYLEGPLCMGQIATACALSYVDFRHGPRNWRDGHPQLAAWEAAISQRPSLAGTAPRE